MITPLENYFFQLKSTLDTDLLKVIKSRVMEVNEYENLKIQRSELEIGNSDPKEFIEKE